MYAATVEDRDLTFAVSGQLWNRSLVMIDLETKSLWSHILGRAMRGPLEGASLEVIPSVMTTWKDWKERNPRSTVLAMNRTARGFKADAQRRPGAFVYGLIWRGQPKAYGFEVLERQPILNDAVGELPVLITFDAATTACRAYDRRAAGRSLVFARIEGSKEVHDQSTGSEWDPTTGRCTRGPLQGTVLKALPGIVSFTHAWATFHPETEYYHSASPQTEQIR